MLNWPPGCFSARFYYRLFSSSYLHLTSPISQLVSAQKSWPSLCNCSWQLHRLQTKSWLNASFKLSMCFCELISASSFLSLKPQVLCTIWLIYRAWLIFDQVVIITGFAEVGPWGSSHTRWEMEVRGEFTIGGYTVRWHGSWDLSSILTADS